MMCGEGAKNNTKDHLTVLCNKISEHEIIK